MWVGAGRWRESGCGRAEEAGFARAVSVWMPAPSHVAGMTGWGVEEAAVEAGYLLVQVQVQREGEGCREGVSLSPRGHGASVVVTRRSDGGVGAGGCTRG